MSSKGFWGFARSYFFGKKPKFRDYLSHLQGLEVIQEETLKMGQTSSTEMLISYKKKMTPSKNPKAFIQQYVAM